MSQPFVATYADVIDSLKEFSTAFGTSVSQESIRRAIQTAYREIISSREWRCLIRNGRVQLEAAQTTGTVAYTHSTRTVTLTGATFPSWSVDGSIRFDDCICDIESVTDTTHVVLDAVLNPGADVAAGTSYTLYPRYYALPADFVSLSSVMKKTLWDRLEELPPNEFFEMCKYEDSTGDPEYFTIAPVQDLYGSMGVYIWPPPLTDEPLDFTYKRRPRNIRYSGGETADYQGTIAVVGASATVTGSGTAFSSDHIGSILRVGTSATAKPTGLEGSSPWVEERCIVAVASATSCTLDAAVTASRSGVKYVISDPIDLDISLFDAFIRNCEKQLAFSRNLNSKADVAAAAEAALFRAKCADGRVTQPIVAGAAFPHRYRLSQSPNRGAVE